MDAGFVSRDGQGQGQGGWWCVFTSRSDVCLMKIWTFGGAADVTKSMRWPAFRRLVGF